MKRTVRAPRVWAWPLAVLLAFAAVAFVLHGIVGFLLGFVAALVIIDRLLPASGALLGDAHQAYARQARRRRVAGWRRRLRRAPGEDGHLRRLAGDFEEGAERHAMGVRAIEVASIVGTTEEEKAHGFDDCFRPPDWTRERWELVWMARMRGTELPPISVYRVGTEHFVRDGHHRVSVARALGDVLIEAEVVILAARPAAGGYAAKR